MDGVLLYIRHPPLGIRQLGDINTPARECNFDRKIGPVMALSVGGIDKDIVDIKIPHLQV